MRRLLFAGAALIAVTLTASCGSGSDPTHVGTPASPVADSTVDNSTSAACGHIRSAVATRMTALGTALGTYVGANAADADDAAEDARETATKDLHDLAADLKRLGASAGADSVQGAAMKASDAVTAIANDSDFVSDVMSVADIPKAVDRISTATRPLADACG